MCNATYALTHLFECHDLAVAPQLPVLNGMSKAKSSDWFRWSRFSKTDLSAIADARSHAAGLPASNTSHQRSLKMLQDLRALVLNRASFRMQAEGPVAIKTSGTAAGGVLECATSGSSGGPKIIRRSHRSWIASFDINARQFNLSQHDTYAVLGALEHSLSLYGALEAGHIGADLCVLAGLRAGKQIELLQAKAVTALYATPTQLESLATVADLDLQLTEMRRIFIGGGALSKALADKCRSTFPNAGLSPFYGASETSFITMASAESPEGSVGTTYPGVEISIRTETGVPTKGIGQIWVRSPYLFAGYAAPVDSDTQHQGGFVTVGEYGHQDENGNLFIKGRKSRMVTVSDQNVFPDEIENFLTVHCKAGPLAVVPVPDTKRGHRLAVVMTQPAHKAALEHAINLCRKALGGHNTPKYILIAPSLPQLASGKLDYVKISAWTKDQL